MGDAREPREKQQQLENPEGVYYWAETWARGRRVVLYERPFRETHTLNLSQR